MINWSLKLAKRQKARFMKSCVDICRMTQSQLKRCLKQKKKKKSKPTLIEKTNIYWQTCNRENTLLIVSEFDICYLPKIHGN